MEGDDPYNWTVEQVCRFFREDAPNFFRSIPSNPQLPNLPPFLEALRGNDVNGFVLLTSVGTGDLRDEFGIRSFGQRSTLLYCINKLRERSPAYSRQNEQGASSQVSNPSPALAQSNSTETLAAEPLSSAPRRPGEVQVQDEHGRKRRKLNLSKLATVAPPSPPPMQIQDGYFGTASMPVDGLFFDKTQLGTEVDHSESVELTILDTDRENESAEHNFQFHALQKPVGESQYVHRQLSRYLRQDPLDLTRSGHHALAVIPYREDLSRMVNKVQSAVVVRCASGGNTPIATRENVAYLDHGGDYNGIAQESALGQYDYLNEKYGGGEQEEKDDDTISMTSTAIDKMDAEIDAEWKEEQAEIAATQAKRLTTEDIEDVVDETVEKFINHWNVKKRPNHEQKHAWTVWKLMKGSKSRRLSLIENAKAKIEDYDRRLSGQKLHVVKAECSTKDEVAKLCKALKVTVLDREEQKWKIEVWQRTQEPNHVVRHGQQTGARTTTSAGQSIPSFVPNAEDRLSVEPAEDAGEVFATPQGSPIPHQDEAEDQGFDGSDEASKMDDFLETDDNQSLSNSIHRDGTNHPQQGEGDGDEASPLTPPSVHVDEEQSVHSSSVPPSSEDLPGMDAFFTQHPSKNTPKTKKTPKKTSNGTPQHDFSKPSQPASASRRKATAVIDISSDSASTPKTGSTRSGRGVTKVDSQNAFLHSMPEKSSVHDVDSWQIANLVHAQDRKRLIIKLLREEGTARMFAIKALWIKRAMVGFKEDISSLLKTLRGDPEASSAQPDPLLQTARLAIVWSCLRPEIMKGQSLDGIDWGAVDRDIPLFISFFGVLMQKSDSKLFVEREQSPSLTPLPNKPSASDIIEIESDTSVDTPLAKKKRKRRVKYSQKAVESQHTAMERQQRYRAAETQSSNSQQLMAMVGSGSVQLPIDLLKQDEGALFIHPAVAHMMKDHQINGVRFMWREITAGADNNEDGQGCVLAHAMGLGKTMQTIILLIAVTEAAQSDDPTVSNQLPKNLRPIEVIRRERSLRILVLCPPSLLDNWRREIGQWANDILGDVYTIEAANKSAQMDILRSWHDYGGVLLMGYALFGRRINRAKAEEKSGVKEIHGDKLDEFLLRGPEILVADEAHNVKNIGSGVSVAVNQIETRSRIALTGTPMSNDVGEMYALISFAAPGFLGGHVEFKAKFGEPIEQGTYADSSAYEQRRSKVKLATLSRLIEPKIHRADITALKGTLQPKVEFVVTLPLTDLQRSAYNKFLEALLGGGKNEKASQVAIFSWLSMLGLLTNHPLAFKRKLNETKKPQKPKSGKVMANGGSTSPIPVDDDSAEGVDYEEVALKTLNFSEETVKHITSDIEDSTDPRLSAKMHILMDILTLSKQCGDKVLVFSSSIPTLNYVGDLLRARGIQFGRICGGVPAPKRPQIIADLTNGLSDVLLISTKAGGVGLNIQAANRVVILDFGFNPAHEEQAIGRAYRFGQPKPVFVYRLITGGTFEDNIYNKQLFKTSLTQRVVDKKNPRRNAARSTRHYLYEPKEVHQQDLEEWVGKDPDVFDQLLKPQLELPQGMIRKLTTIETLQREGDDPPLDAAELQQAEEEYQTSIAAAMGPRGLVANLDGISGFVAAQVRQTLTPRMRSTQQQTPRQSLIVKLPSPPSRGPASTAPSIDTRPKPTISMPNTMTSRKHPHGLPASRSPQAGSSHT